jgi:LmbE family N-acetylglucosaminyl deacetylase
MCLCPCSALHHAIRAKEADRALEVAGKMKRVPLRYAARLTVLLADMKHPRDEAAARRFIVAFTEELEPPTMQVKKVADALAHVHHYYFARDALQDLIGQLHEQGRSVEVDFDSEPDNPARKPKPLSHP